MHALRHLRIVYCGTHANGALDSHVYQLFESIDILINNCKLDDLTISIPGSGGLAAISSHFAF